ncbi:hypothetical protein ABPG72_010009 [Tetrahymena utriculariae]
MNPEQYGSELLQQYENMIANVAEWRTNIYNILHLAQWKKQQSPRMQSDINLIQNALTIPQNYDIGDFAVQQVNIMIGYKSLFEQLVESHRQLLQGYQNVLSLSLLLDLEQKTMTLLTYFNYLPLSASAQCVPLVMVQTEIKKNTSACNFDESQGSFSQIPNQQTIFSSSVQSLSHIESNIQDETIFNGKSSVGSISYIIEKGFEQSFSNNSSWASINSMGQSEAIIDVE